ncbi:hypothetical protein J0X14_12760 [Muricauda sp. CAU 1633]|uniref:hypothetical protein n=1 Tax=Allomuricauda sp. CAU 1633 TaxID=2816036 RepID=UPI001A8F1F14|nr:hypothetical protein [Muricauda sp. CAU 1633]MBO0323171.1 hypothetical protein [Muricauda sp. CAU 1633]
MAPVAEQNTHQVQELLVRLERNNKVIQRLSKKLTSYTCEPNNPSCFEKLYEIKNSFKTFRKHQEHIAELLKSQKDDARELKQKIELHLERFKQLEKAIAGYLLGTQQHH